MCEFEQIDFESNTFFTISREDKDGKGCDYYENASYYCTGAARWADRKGVSALDACCTCNGGDQGDSGSCRDNEDFKDRDGFNCEVYERNPLWCDYAEDYEKNGMFRLF